MHHPSIHPSIHQSINKTHLIIYETLPTHASKYLSFFHPSIHPNLSVQKNTSNYLSIKYIYKTLHIYLSVCLSIYNTEPSITSNFYLSISISVLLYLSSIHPSIHPSFCLVSVSVQLTAHISQLSCSERQSHSVI